MNDEGSDEVFAPTPMARATIAAHDVFISALGAGFNEGQALYLAACLVCGGPRAPMGAL